MAITKQTQAAKRTMKQGQRAATTSSKTIAHMPAQAKSAISKRGAAVAQRKRTGGAPKTKAELYEMAKRRDLPGRSKMGRDELARKLGQR